MNIKELKIVKTNIISSISVSLNYQYLASLDRQDDTLSSKMIHSLSVFTFPDLQLISKEQVYRTYSKSKHLVKFSVDTKQIFVVTRYQIQIFEFSNNRITKKQAILHNQNNIYDFDVSFDGKFILLVGDEVNLWNLVDKQKITIPNMIGSKFAEFSYDNKYLYLCTTTKITKLSYLGKTTFQKINQKDSSPQKGQITSMSINPINSQQVALGFLNDNPQIYNSDGSFFSRTEGNQPDRQENSKQVVFMPDGIRIVSSDQKNGIGIWPGIQNKLFYMENNLNYGLLSNQKGTAIVSYAQNTIKLMSIQIKCQNDQYLPQCPCNHDKIWDYANYSCKIIDCSSVLNSSGKLSTTGCQCKNFYKFDRIDKQCKLNCSSFPNAITNIGQNCSCKYLYQWNDQTKSCDFSCMEVKHSTGVILEENNTCQCKEGFIWNETLKICQCPSYKRLVPGNVYVPETCECIEKYIEIKTTNQCFIPICSLFQNVNITNVKQRTKTSCACNDGYEFTLIGDHAGCKLNCASIINAKEDTVNFNRCLCQQNTYWNGTNCIPNCTSIILAKINQKTPQVCDCAENYFWSSENNQCNRNCTGIAHVNISQTFSLKKCSCNQHFKWDETYQQCVINCDNIKHASNYETFNPETCKCTHKYKWNPLTLSCILDCSKISQAYNSQSDQSCKCSGSKIFNPEKKICEESSQISSNVISIWFIILAIMASIAVIIAVIILFRFCWVVARSYHQEPSFSKNGQSRKKKNQQKTTQEAPMTKRFLKVIHSMPKVEPDDIQNGKE